MDDHRGRRNSGDDRFIGHMPGVARRHDAAYVIGYEMVNVQREGYSYPSNEYDSLDPMFDNICQYENQSSAMPYGFYLPTESRGSEEVCKLNKKLCGIIAVILVSNCLAIGFGIGIYYGVGNPSRRTSPDTEVQSFTTQAPTDASTTKVSTTAASTNKFSTTASSTTQASTTAASTTQASINASTSQSSTTAVSTTNASTTALQTTLVLQTPAPTTATPYSSMFNITLKLNQEWTESLNNVSSPEYMGMIQKIQQSIDRLVNESILSDYAAEVKVIQIGNWSGLMTTVQTDVNLTLKMKSTARLEPDDVRGSMISVIIEFTQINPIEEIIPKIDIFSISVQPV